MSASVLRNPLRTALRRSAARPAQFRQTFNRQFSTPPPPPAPAAKSNTALYLTLGAVAAGGLGYYFLSDSSAAKEAGTSVKSGVQAAKVKANFVPTKEDYIKVSRSLSILQCNSLLMM